MSDHDPANDTLLIVDDEANIRPALSRLFRRDGYQSLRRLRGIGLSPHDPLETIADVDPDWVRAKVFNEGMPGAASQGSWAGETAVLDASGREIPVHQLILAHRNEKGEIDFYSTLMRDIADTNPGCPHRAGVTSEAV